MKGLKHEEGPLMGLSEDLILEILFRSTIRSLGRLCCVSKKLDTLISNPGFAISRLNFSNATTPPLTLAMQKYNTISSLKFRSSTDITKGVNLIGLDRQFDDDNSFDGCYFFIVGSCHGLLCLYIKEKKKRGKDLMYLWNPTTNESRKISLPVERSLTYVKVDSCWFGFLPSLNDYKILLVYTVYKPAYADHMYLYSLRNKRWEEVRVCDKDLSSISQSDSVFMDEALHYLIRRQCIFKFDLVTETLKRISISFAPELFSNAYQTYLSVIGEYDCLCVGFVHHSKKNVQRVSDDDSEGDEGDKWMFELWMLEEYNNWGSWKKLYNIDLQEKIARRCTQFLGITYSGLLCFLNVHDRLVLIDPSWDPPSHVIVGNCAKVYKLISYVRSLVSPSSPFVVDDDEQPGGNSCLRTSFRLPPCPWIAVSGGVNVDATDDDDDEEEDDDGADSDDDDGDDHNNDGGDSDDSDDDDDGDDHDDDDDGGGDEDEEDGGGGINLTLSL
ncbi:hypothetical protein SOVF_030660 [Spinacia oleracea]|uniref:F-box protein At3g07870 n=1 Tax=Spinacia oleracea TaxID=3562 RepID=A0A9R0IL00_SPIOL|nr:F-box protein At3g07870-like [Spinacia oleracea]KNA22764.1 hypothetical protein SOVF_030660 [Spinacia oleracea]